MYFVESSDNNNTTVNTVGVGVFSIRVFFALVLINGAVHGARQYPPFPFPASVGFMVLAVYAKSNQIIDFASEFACERPEIISSIVFVFHAVPSGLNRHAARDAQQPQPCPQRSLLPEKKNQDLQMKVT